MMNKPNIVRLAFAFASLVAVTIASGQEPRPLGDVGGRLQGTWDVQVTIIDCDTGQEITTSPSLVTFMVGGTMSTSGTPPALKTPGAGVWYHTTDHNYVYSFKHFNFNTSNVFTGWNIIHAEVAVDPIGNSLRGSGTAEIYDANGVLIATGCTRIAATRFEL